MVSMFCLFCTEERENCNCQANFIDIFWAFLKKMKYLCPGWFHSVNAGWTKCINILLASEKNFCLTLTAPCITKSCIKIKINLTFYFHTTFWYLKDFMKVLIFSIPPGSERERFNTDSTRVPCIDVILKLFSLALNKYFDTGYLRFSVTVQIRVGIWFCCNFRKRIVKGQCDDYL